MQNRDYTLMLDKSGSMGSPLGNTTRWKSVAETAEAVARKCAEYDPDGITVYTFSSNYTRFDNTTPEKVGEIFKSQSPSGSTALDLVLNHAFQNYLSRKATGKAQANGESVFVITDGQPDDPAAVAQVITNFTKKLDSAQEFSVTFVQIGDDTMATQYLQKLDDDLEKQGAKYDIVSVITAKELGNQNIADVIVKAITEAKLAKGAA